MITVVTWLWRNPGSVFFGSEYVNRLRSMLERNLHVPHEMVCITDLPEGIDKRVRIVRPPVPLPGAIRCRRRMWQFAAERRHDLGPRILAIDLDVVAVADLTPIVDRPEPLVLWRVGYAQCYSGSFALFDAGVLDGAWRAYARDPIGFPNHCKEKNASDQAMLNYWIKANRVPVAALTEANGLRTWFGTGYEDREHHGMGPTRNVPPPGTRIVVLGSSDKHVLDHGQYAFVRDHWR